jgi:hypothetical protein
MIQGLEVEHQELISRGKHKMKKTLAAITLSALAGLGCGGKKGPNHTEYHFNDTIGIESVYFHESSDGKKNFLWVVGIDNTIVLFADTAGDDLVADYVKVCSNEEITTYYNRPESRFNSLVFNAWQASFEEYLRRIKEKNTLNKV